MLTLPLDRCARPRVSTSSTTATCGRLDMDTFAWEILTGTVLLLTFPLHITGIVKLVFARVHAFISRPAPSFKIHYISVFCSQRRALRTLGTSHGTLEEPFAGVWRLLQRRQRCQVSLQLVCSSENC